MREQEVAHTEWDGLQLDDKTVRIQAKPQFDKWKPKTVRARGRSRSPTLSYATSRKRRKGTGSCFRLLAAAWTSISYESWRKLGEKVGREGTSGCTDSATLGSPT